jgi:hypothetical protein
MNYLDLKNFINRQIRVVFYYDYTQDFEPGLFCEIDGKYRDYKFIEDINQLKEKLFEQLLILDSNQSSRRVLIEYEMLMNDFVTYKLNGQEFIKFKNLQIFVDEKFLQFGVDYNLHMNKRHWKEEPKWFTDYDDNTFIRDLVKLQDITNDRIANDISDLSQKILEILKGIIDFFNTHFNSESATEAKKSLFDQLSVKRQILILHYIFDYYKNSNSELPNNKLSLLLAKVLGRNSETIRGLLTLMSRVEDSEADDKIAKTPKNMMAVAELFGSIKLPQLLNLVEKDLKKLTK